MYYVCMAITFQNSIDNAGAQMVIMFAVAKANNAVANDDVQQMALIATSAKAITAATMGATVSGPSAPLQRSVSQQQVSVCFCNQSYEFVIKFVTFFHDIELQHDMDICH